MTTTMIRQERPIIPRDDATTRLALVQQLFGEECYTISDLGQVGQPIVHASAAFARFSGYAVASVVGRDLGFLQRDDDDPEAQREVRQAVAEGRPCTVVVRNYRRDGSLFWNEQRHYPLRDEHGRITHLVVVQRDVTERVQALGLVDAGEGMSRYLDGAGFFGYSMLLRPDRPPQLLWVSDASRHLIGYAAEELQSRGAGWWVHPDDRERFTEGLATRREARQHAISYRIVTAGGATRWVEDHAQRTWTNDASSAVAVHALVRDVTQQRRREGEAWQVEHVDGLTGLPTRRLFLDRLGQALARSRRDAGTAALVLLDLDHFGFVNETIGREQGDRILQEVAHRLQRLVRESDVLAREAGDRFALLLHGAGTPADLLAALEKLRRGLDAPYRWSGGTMELSATVGVRLLDGADITPRAALDDAGAALERAKRQARGGYAVAGDESDARVRARERAESEVRQAIARDQLILHYQPRIDLRTGGVAGVEALVRWLHPERGLLKPAQFLPLVEAARLDAALFRWVLDRALLQAEAWREAGHPQRVAVNVGRQALQHPSFATWVHEALAERDLNPAMLELELTEDTPFHVFEGRIEALRSLRDHGIRLSLDDFGVATASLSQLQQLPLDALKIDRRFIERLEAGHRGDREMVGAIVSIGRSLSLTVVAEGIETDVQRRLLQDLRCDEGQGYLYSQALPGDYVPLDTASSPPPGG